MRLLSRGKVNPVELWHHYEGPRHLEDVVRQKGGQVVYVAFRTYTAVVPERTAQILRDADVLLQPLPLDPELNGIEGIRKYLAASR
jgi:hypothetical protein